MTRTALVVSDVDGTLLTKDKTLTDPEIEAIVEKIVAAVTKATGGTLRT